MRPRQAEHLLFHDWQELDQLLLEWESSRFALLRSYWAAKMAGLREAATSRVLSYPTSDRDRLVGVGEVSAYRRGTMIYEDIRKEVSDALRSSEGEKDDA